jgi:hypothetical protein
MKAFGATFPWLGKWFATTTIMLLPVLALAQTDAEQVYKQVAPAVVTVMAGDSTGTGFLVRDRRTFVTAAHVIDNGEIPVVRYGRGTLLQVRSMVVSKDLDLAILEVDDEVAATPIPLGDRETISPGTQVYAIGTALGALSHTLTDGMVSGIRRVGDKELLQVSSPMSPGMSGGPVLSRNGRVLGVISFTLIEGQNLNIAVAAKHVRRLLAEPLRPAEVVSAQLNKSASAPTVQKSGPAAKPPKAEVAKSDATPVNTQARAQALADLLSEVEWWTSTASNDAFRLYIESNTSEVWRSIFNAVEAAKKKMPLFAVDRVVTDEDLLNRLLKTINEQERVLIFDAIVNIQRAMTELASAYGRASVDLNSPVATEEEIRKSYRLAQDADSRLDALTTDLFLLVVSISGADLTLDMLSPKFHADLTATMLGVHFDSARPDVAAVRWKYQHSADFRVGDVIVGMASASASTWTPISNWKDVWEFLMTVEKGASVRVQLRGGRTLFVRNAGLREGKSD